MKTNDYRNWLKRTSAALLAALMLFTAMPVTALASDFTSLLKKGPAYNEELLTTLQSMCGEGQDAKTILNTLREYGLVDEEGFPVVGGSFDVDGEEMTLDELSEQADFWDASDEVYIDGMHTTWGEIKTLLDVNGEVNALLDFMDTGVTFEEGSAQSAALDSLLAQLQTKGVMMIGDPAETTFGAGLNHQARVTVTANNAPLTRSDGGETVNLTASLNVEQGADVTFSYQAVSGSAKATGSGTVTIPKGATSANFSVTYSGEPERYTGARTFLVNVYGLTNALFLNSTPSAQVPVTVNDDFTFVFEHDIEKSMDTANPKIDLSGQWKEATETLAITGADVAAKTDWTYNRYVMTFDFHPVHTKGTDGYAGFSNGNCYSYNYYGSYAGTDMLFDSENCALQDEADGIVSLLPKHDGINWTALSFGETLATTATGNDQPRYAFTYKSEAHDVTPDEFSDSTAWTVSVHYKTGQDVLSSIKVTGGISIALHVKEIHTKLSLTGLSTPDATFYEGQLVPITVTFDDKVQISDGIQMTMSNGRVLTPVETGSVGTTCTFLYEVTTGEMGSVPDVLELDVGATKLYSGDTAKIPSTDASPASATGFNLAVLADANSNIKLSNNNCLIRSYKLSGLTGFSASIDDAKPTLQHVTAKLDLASNTELFTWLTTGGAHAPIDGLKLDTRPDLCKASEVQAALPAPYNDIAKYSVEEYATGLYLSADGGALRYPFYIVAQLTDDSATNELPVMLVSYYKPLMNESETDRVDTVELYLDPDIASTTDYIWNQNETDPALSGWHSGEAAPKAPVVLSVMGDKETAAYAEYTVKHAVFFYPGDADVEYRNPTSTDPFLSDWAALTDDAGASLVSYSIKLDPADPKVRIKDGDNYVYVAKKGEAAADMASTLTEDTITLREEVAGEPPVPAITDSVSVLASPYITKPFYVQEDMLSLTASLMKKNFTFTDKENLFWISSDETVANVETTIRAEGERDIAADALITPTGKSGQVYFTLYALNYAIDGFYPVEVCRSVTLEVKAGLTPMLTVPKGGDDVALRTARQGSDLDLTFTSNLTERNADAELQLAMKDTPDMSEEDRQTLKEGVVTTFAVELYAADEAGAPTGGVLTTFTQDSTVGETAGRIKLDGAAFENVTTRACDYVAVLSAVSVVVDKDGNRVETPISANVRIKVLPAPCKVVFDKLPSYSIQSGESVTIGYTTMGMNESSVTGYTIEGIHTGVAANGALTNGAGRIDFTPEPVTDSLREGYVVSAHIENGGDVPAANDSFILYVYNNAALRLLVDAADGKTNAQTDVESVSLDNHPKLAALMNDDHTITLGDTTVTLQELMEDTNLSAVVSINYGDYVWGILSDQIEWLATDLKTGNTGTGEDLNNITPTTLNFAQAGAYSNLTTYPYTSYAPASRLMAVGLSTGETEITATHARTGMTDRIVVTTSTVKDQLYLFQVFPKALTNVTYTNGKNKTFTVQTNENGELAIYDEDSIASDVQFCSADGEFIGCIERRNLVTEERDVSRLQTYPVNNLKLRPVANVSLFVKNADGTPYANMPVEMRGGVYKNDVYCPAAGLGMVKGGVTNDGKLPQNFTTDPSGVLRVYLDSMEMVTPDEVTNSEKQLECTDKLEYIFQLRFPAENEQAEPQLIHIEVSSDKDAVAQASDTIVTMRPVASASMSKTPVTNRQVFVGYDRGTKLPVYNEDIYGRVDGAGISYQYPNATLTTEVIFWGHEAEITQAPLVSGNTDYGVMTVIPEEEIEKYQHFYYDVEGYQPVRQTSTVITYPFADVPVSQNVWEMKKAEIDRWVPDPNSIGLQVAYLTDGAVEKTNVNSFRASNTSDTDPIVDEKMNAAEGNAMTAVSSNLSPGGIFDSMESDDKTSPAFTFLSSLKTNKGIPIGITLAPTEDPATFHAVVIVGNANGAGGGDDKEDGKGSGKTDNGGSYKSDYKDSKEGDKPEESDPFKHKVGPATLTIGGYMMCNINFTPENGEWGIVFVGGGFNADLGISKEWKKTFMCGPVPATISFEIGADLTLDFGAAIRYLGEDIGNDFLTQIGVTAHVEAFAGVGFDAGVVAMKIGIFGRVEVGTWISILNAISWEGGGVDTSFGSKTGITGTIGLKLTCKILLVDYETVFAAKVWEYAYKTDGWTKNEDYWNNVTTGTGGDTLAAYHMGNGAMLYALSGASMESRAYLDDAERVWNGGKTASIALDEENQVGSLQTNSYSFAEPQYNDDGSLLVYLSDSDSTALEDTLASYALRGTNGYTDEHGIAPVTYTGEGADVMHNATHEPLGEAAPDGDDPVYDEEGHVISPFRKTKRTGYGDSSLRVSGVKNLTAAAWVRMTEPLTKEAGEEATYDDLNSMMNSSEVMVSVYESGDWTTTRLTTNSTPDLSPVIAVQGTRAVAAWRSVAASDAENPMDFSVRNEISYAIYENGVWSEPAVAYDGESGSPSGLQMAMLPGGETLMAFMVDFDETGSDDVAGSEILYTALDAAGAPVRTVRATNDAWLDENVQVTNVEWHDEDVFLLGWYSEPDGSGDGAKGDIRLLAVNADGLPDGAFVENISSAGASGVTRTFRFSRPAEGATLDTLSVIWAQLVMPEMDAEPMGGEAKDVVNTSSGTPVLQAVKFYEDDAENVRVSAPIEVARMEEGSIIDSFAAYNEDEQIMHAVLQSTAHLSDEIDPDDPDSYERVDEVTQSLGADDNGNEITGTVLIYTPNSETRMYTATGAYTEVAVEVLAADYHADNVIRGLRLPVQFTVKNTGTQRLNGLTIELAGNAPQTIQQVVWPGDTVMVTAYYDIPEDYVNDVEYTVTGLTNLKAGRGAYIGTLTLNLPDASISSFLVTEETERTRTVQVRLGNSSDIPFETSGKTVNIELYGSMQEMNADDPTKALATAAIADDASLALMDQQAYYWQYTLDADTVEGMLEKQGNWKAGEEIPSTGITVFAKVTVTDTANNVIEQHNPQDNTKALSMYGLLKKNNNIKVTTATQLVKNTEGEGPDAPVASVDVLTTLRNNSYAEPANGNVLAALLDKDGNVISQPKQAYNGTPDDYGLLLVEREATAEYPLNFTADDLLEGHTLDEVATAYALYGDVDLEDASATLANLNLRGEPVRLSSFDEQIAKAKPRYTEGDPTGEGDAAQPVSNVNYKYIVTVPAAANLKSTVLAALPLNPTDHVELTLNGKTAAEGPGGQLASTKLSSGGLTASVTVTGGVFTAWADTKTGEQLATNELGRPVAVIGKGKEAQTVEILDYTDSENPTLKPEYTDLFALQNFRNVRTYTIVVSGSDDGGEEVSTFWRDVEQAVVESEKALTEGKPGGLVEVFAGWEDQMPFYVMDALRANPDVALVIHWNGGETVTIPAGQAKTNEPNRIYWPLALLSQLYSGAVLPEALLNPETGGVLYVASPTAQISAGKALPDSLTGELAGEAPAIAGVITPADAGIRLAADSAEQTSSVLPYAAGGAALLLAAVLILLLRGRKRGAGEETK